MKVNSILFFKWGELNILQKKDTYSLWDSDAF